MYIDIVIFSKSEEEHYDHFRDIFARLQATNLKVQLDKCNFLKTEIEFLQFLISADDIKNNK